MRIKMESGGKKKSRLKRSPFFSRKDFPHLLGKGAKSTKLGGGVSNPSLSFFPSPYRPCREEECHQCIKHYSDRRPIPPFPLTTRSQ